MPIVPPTLDRTLEATMLQLIPDTQGIGGHVILDTLDAPTIQALLDAGIIEPETS